MAARDTDLSATPSAKFLQARITALSTTLIKRLENIFAATLEDPSAAGPNSNDPNPPALTDTAVKQLQLDVESTALVRAAEELMILTRTMKELWLFGGLDTIPKEAIGSDEQAAEPSSDMAKDEKVVMGGFIEFLTRLETGDSISMRSNGNTKFLDG